MKYFNLQKQKWLHIVKTYLIKYKSMKKFQKHFLMFGLKIKRKQDLKKWYLIQLLKRMKKIIINLKVFNMIKLMLILKD